MHVAIDASSAVRQRGGIPEYTRQLLAGLGRVDHSNIYHVVTIGRHKAAIYELPKLPDNFIPHHIAWPYKLLRLAVQVTGQPRINRWVPEFDIFFAPHFFLPADNFNKLIITIHDVLFLDHPEWFTPREAAYFTKLVHDAARRATHIVTDSQASKADILRHKLGRDDNVSVVPLGTDVAPASAAAVARARAAYQLPDEYLLYLGTIEPRKNILNLVRAYGQLVAKGYNLPLVMAGRRGWLGQELEALLAQLDLGNHVRFLGGVTDADRVALLTGARVFLFPSLAEGFGLPPLEAMAAGTPVVTSTASSLPEVVGDAALTVEPTNTAAIAESIERILVDDDLAQALRKRGLARAAQYRWDQTARAMQTIFEKVNS